MQLVDENDAARGAAHFHATLIEALTQWVSDAAHAEARACFRDFREVQVADCGHNLHHDQPDAVARIIESFLLSKES